MITQSMMKTASDELSRAASEVTLMRRNFSEAYEYDSQFDGGEFSGPAIGRMEEDEEERIAKKYGFVSFEQLYSAIAQRTTGKFAFFKLR